MKYVLFAIMLIIFTGCSTTYQQFKDGYKDAKIVYKDIRYVVYEVEDKGFNVDTSEKSGSIK